MTELSLSEQISTLREQGFVVVRSLVDQAHCTAMKQIAEQALAQKVSPVEFEADLRYPGAPTSRDSEGGETIRRLLNAYGRDLSFQEWACSPFIRAWMQAYFDTPVLLSQTHHNCIMTKHPTYGSLTGWHRDARYWSFEQDDLVSVWLALGTEKIENGALWFIPKSHQLELPAECFDEQAFFRTDLPGNAALIRTAVSPELNAGDVVFFHCNTLHSAEQNRTNQVKLSLVFTYHSVDNAPLPNTRSSAKSEVLLEHFSDNSQTEPSHPNNIGLMQAGIAQRPSIQEVR